MGDLNRLKTSSTSRSFKLKQLVNFPTRGERTLDVILTYIPQFNDIPEKLAPFGLYPLVWPFYDITVSKSQTF